MTAQEIASTLTLSYKSLEILLIVSVTVNFCVSWSVILPKMCRSVLRGFGRKREQGIEEQANDMPSICRRFATNLVFCVALPVCGIVLLTSSDVLLKPFSTFDGSFRLVFSIALGHYIFKTAEVVTFQREIFHFKPLLVHHLVAIATYITILKYEQNAIMGVVMLLVEGSLVFAENEREYFRHVAGTREESKMRKFGSVVVFLLAIAIKGVLPVSLIVIAFLTSLDKLLIMSYVPLAFFFLSLVFFAAVDLWFFRDACTEVSRQFSRPSPRLIIIPIHNNSMPSPPTTAINNDGLKKLLLSRDGVGGSVHITENALWDKDLNLSRDLDMPAILPLQSSTPDEMKGQLVIDM